MCLVFFNGIDKRMILVYDEKYKYKAKLINRSVYDK